jgi:hypothetical protein
MPLLPFRISLPISETLLWQSFQTTNSILIAELLPEVKSS